MANKGFNGTTVTFPSTSTVVGLLRGASYTESSAEVNVTGVADAAQSHVAGIPKKELSLDLLGCSTALTVGSTGSMKVNWFDGKTSNLGKVVIISRDVKGQMDGEITTAVKVTKNTTA